ncbi:MAG: hypothetical protein SW833_24830 [Cyanobacteriota bacterium]|nr:hypothetical protein [Cyanobacteriota bacterium]
MSKAKVSIYFAAALALSSILGLYPADRAQAETLENPVELPLENPVQPFENQPQPFENQPQPFENQPQPFENQPQPFENQPQPIEYRYESVLSLDCVDADGKPSNNFEGSDRGVSINRRFYRAMGRAYPGAKMTCEIPVESDPRQVPSRLILEFGFNDATAGTSPVQVMAYADGSLSQAEVITAGVVQKISLPVERASSIALDVECSATTACNHWVYFTRAEIEYIILPVTD